LYSILKGDQANCAGTNGVFAKQTPHLYQRNRINFWEIPGLLEDQHQQQDDRSDQDKQEYANDQGDDQADDGQNYSQYRADDAKYQAEDPADEAEDEFD
jgi:hypothetical protein